MYARFLKRPLDFFCALAAILALSPLLLVLTLLGAIKMHGNPFFTQPRPGKGERIFRLVKFRTMTNERDAQGNLLLARNHKFANLGFCKLFSFCHIYFTPPLDYCLLEGFSISIVHHRCSIHQLRFLTQLLDIG